MSSRDVESFCRTLGIGLLLALPFMLPLGGLFAAIHFIIKYW